MARATSVAWSTSAYADIRAVSASPSAAPASRRLPAISLGTEALGVGRGLARDALRGSLLGRAAALVLALLHDELFLAPGELDLVLELVLGDAPARARPPWHGARSRLVRVLLHELARRGLQCAFDVRLRADGDDADVDDAQADLAQAFVAAQASRHPLAHGAHAFGERLRQRHLCEQGKRVLLRRARSAARPPAPRGCRARGRGLDRC